MHPRPSRRWEAAGHTLVDLLAAISLVATMAAVGIPQLLAGAQRPKAQAATRYLAARMVRARTQAVMRSATVALRFQQNSQGFAVAGFLDGNRNGVRTADIASGIDRPLEASVRLSDLFPTVTIAYSQDGIDLNPVQIGNSTLLSFTPQGTSTSGSIYVKGTDGSQYAIRVLGATGRVRVVRYLPVTRTWVDGL